MIVRGAVSHRYNVIILLFYLTASPSSYWTTWSAHTHKQSHLQHSATFVSPKNYYIPLLLHKSSTMQPPPFFLLLPLDTPLFPSTLSNLVPKLPLLNGPWSSMRWTSLLASGDLGGGVEGPNKLKKKTQGWDRGRLLSELGAVCKSHELCPLLGNNAIGSPAPWALDIIVTHNPWYTHCMCSQEITTLPKLLFLSPQGYQSIHSLSLPNTACIGHFGFCTHSCSERHMVEDE